MLSSAAVSCREPAASGFMASSEGPSLHHYCGSYGDTTSLGDLLEVFVEIERNTHSFSPQPFSCDRVPTHRGIDILSVPQGLFNEQHTYRTITVIMNKRGQDPPSRQYGSKDNPKRMREMDSAFGSCHS